MALSKQAIGELGENLPESRFTGIVNLNTFHKNFPLFDHLAYLDGQLYVFTTKSRSKYGRNGKQNVSYNLLPANATRKFHTACALLRGHGYDPSAARYGFIVSRLDPETPTTTYYWGELSDIKPGCCYTTLNDGTVRRVCLPTKDSDLESYKVLGTRVRE